MQQENMSVSDSLESLQAKLKLAVGPKKKRTRQALRKKISRIQKQISAGDTPTVIGAPVTNKKKGRNVAKKLSKSMPVNHAKTAKNMQKKKSLVLQKVANSNKEALRARDTNSPDKRITKPVDAPEKPPGTKWMPPQTPAEVMTTAAPVVEISSPAALKAGPTLSDILEELDAQLVISEKVDAAAKDELTSLSPSFKKMDGINVEEERANLPRMSPASKAVEAVIGRSTDNVTEYLTWETVDSKVVDDVQMEEENEVLLHKTNSDATVKTSTVSASEPSPARQVQQPSNTVSEPDVKRCMNCIVC